MVDNVVRVGGDTIEFAEAPKKGARIEVIVRYDGQEWLAAKGTIEQVDIHNEIVEAPMMVGDGFKRYVHTGRRDLTITLFDPPEDPDRKALTRGQNVPHTG